MTALEERHIIVAHIICGTETVVVRNPEGRRQDWQLPGGRIRENMNPKNEAVRVLEVELGLKIPLDKLVLAKNLTRRTETAHQIIYFFRANLPVGSLDVIPEESMDGHFPRRLPSRQLFSLLKPADKDLLSS